MTLLARCDYARPFVHWPLSSDRTRSIAYFLFPKEKFEEPGFTAKVQVYADYLSTVLSEDVTLIKSIQHAAGTRDFAPGRLSTMEHAIHHVTVNYLKRMYR
jgi:hypothetical protein